MCRISKIQTLILGGALFGILTPVGFAQEPDSELNELMLEEVIVTTQKRQQSLQDVPVAVTALTKAEIERQRINKIEDLESLSPSLIMVELALAQNLGMRGIYSGENQGFEQSVGTYVDGIYRGRPLQARIPFLDVERVEVLRGPQSILFGKNSVAGALNIVTARPTSDFEGGASLVYGHTDGGFDAWELDGFVSGPFSDTVRGRLAVRYNDSEGFMENLHLGDSGPDFEEKQVRGQIQFDLSDDLTMNFKIEYAEFDRAGFILETADEVPSAVTGLTYAETLVYGFGQPAVVLNNVQDFKNHSEGDISENDFEEYVLDFDYQLGDLELKSITGFSKYSYSDALDTDFTAATVFDLLSQESFEQLSQEFRLVSPTGGNFDYIIGTYFEKSEFDFADAIRIPENSVLVPLGNFIAPPDSLFPGFPGAGAALAGTSSPRRVGQDGKSWSVFFQGTYHLGDAWRLTGGLRYTWEEKDAYRVLDFADYEQNPLDPFSYLLAAGVYGQLFNINAHQIVDDRTDSKFLPTVIVEYDASDEVMVYGSYRVGAKSGGFDVRSNNHPDMGGAFKFEDEKNTSFELGTKISIGSRATVNIAAYTTTFEDMQVSIFDGVLGFNVQNAGEADINGLEFDGRWLAAEGLILTGSFAITDFEWTEFENGPCHIYATPTDPSTQTCDFKGRSNQFVADWNGNLGVEYITPIADDYELVFNFDMQFTDDYITQANQDPTQIQDGYTSFDMRVGFGPADGRWEVALWGENLGNEAIVVDSADTPLAYGIFQTPSYVHLMARPRSIGLELIGRF